jgi:hypothetical protein
VAADTSRPHQRPQRSWEVGLAASSPVRIHVDDVSVVQIEDDKNASAREGTNSGEQSIPEILIAIALQIHER